MRVRCLSLFAEYIDEIAAGRKVDEFRSYRIEPGPLALATNKKSGRAELRLLVDITGSDAIESDGESGEWIDGIWYDNSGSGDYANHLANVRHLRRDPVETACYNCAAGRRDTHARIFYVEATLASAPPIKIAAPRIPAQIIRPPQPTSAASPLALPSMATKSTALRPIDPFAIRRPSMLEQAIAEFGDTPEVRALFGEE